MVKTRPILKYPGAKWSTASWIIGHFPAHDIYLEPYFGSGAAFFSKDPARLEAINDLDGNVVNLFKVIRERPQELSDLISFTPWARDEYISSYEKTGDELEDARRFLVRCWQAFGTLTGQKTGWRHSATGRCPAMPAQWVQVPDRILHLSQRLLSAQIENMDAIHLIKKYNDPSCLIYADPPYVPGTRRKKIYACEMDTVEHIQLLQALKNHSGPVVLSGYDNDLYSSMLDNWKRVEKRSAAERGQSRIEVLWINAAATAQSAI